MTSNALCSPQRLIKTLINKKLSIVAAESMTAGLLASTIVSAGGTSDVIKGSVVTYDADFKTKLLGVNPSLIQTYTAESQETTDAMCEGLSTLYPGEPLYVAVTGLASAPTDHKHEHKKAGQVYVTIRFYKKVYRFDEQLNHHPEDPPLIVRHLAVAFIINKIFEIVTLGHECE